MSLTPVLPMCGAVIATICRQYDGSVSVSWYPVIPVLKTISPNVSPSAPNPVPRKVVPSSRMSRAGRAISVSPIQASFPSSTVGTPRRKVATTRPGSSIPAKGVLRLLDAPADVTASAGAAGSYKVR